MTKPKKEPIEPIEPTCAGMHIPAKKGQRCGRCGKEGVCNWEDED